VIFFADTTNALLPKFRRRRGKLPFGKTGIPLTVRNHHDGCAVFVEVGKERHYFKTVFRVEISGRVVKNIPLLYDAVTRTLANKCTVDMCRVIVESGCDLNVAYNGKTAVYLALDYIATHPKVECGTAEEILQTIAERGDFDAKYRYESLLPPLAYLIRENRVFLGKFNNDFISDNVLKLLLDKGGAINTYDNDGNSLMNFAIETGNKFLADYFIEKGIDLSKMNKQGNDAMYAAIDNGQKEIIEKLINLGYNLNVNTLKNKPSSFMNFSESYQYVSQICADKAVEYSDLIKFKRLFSDRFSLIKTKIDKIYFEESLFLDTAVNHIYMYLENILSEEDLKIKTFYGLAERFARKHNEYDPENKISIAQKIIRLNDVLRGINLQINSVDYYSRRFTSSHPRYGTYYSNTEASWDKFVLSQSLNSVNEIIEASDFGMENNPFFISKKEELERKKSKFASVYGEALALYKQRENVYFRIL
jgi:hypothetical protein